MKYYVDLVQQAKQEWTIIKMCITIPHYFGSFLKEELHMTVDDIRNLEAIAHSNNHKVDFGTCNLPTDHLLFDQWLCFSADKLQSYNLCQLGSFSVFVQKLKAYTHIHYPLQPRKVTLTSPQVDEKKKSFFLSFFSFRWCSLI